MATLPPLATHGDLADWIGEPITDEADVKRAEGVLSLASVLVRRHVGETPWGEDASPPDGVKEVVLQCAARSYTNPEGWGNERLDDWGGGQRPVDEWGLYLTKSEKVILDQHRPRVVRGIGVVATTKSTRPDPGAGWVPTVDGPPFPWY